MDRTKRQSGFLIVFALALVVGGLAPRPADAGLALRELGRHESVDTDSPPDGTDDIVVNEPVDVAISGGLVYVTDHDPGEVLAYARNAAGDLVSPPAETSTGLCVGTAVGGPCQSDADCVAGSCFKSLRGASSIALTPDGLCAYVGSDIVDTVTIFVRNASGILTGIGLRGSERCATGRIGIECETDDDCDTSAGSNDGSCVNLGLKGVKDLALNSTGTNLYVLGGADNSITTFSRVAPSCDLELVDVLSDGANSVQLKGPVSIALSPDQANAYVATDADESIAIFDRNLANGTLVPTPDPGNPGQPAVVFAATCENVVPKKACNDNKDCTSAQGKTKCSIHLESLLETREIALSPDGASLYAAARGLPGFARDALTGLLTHLDVEPDLSSFKLSGGQSIALTSGGTELLYGTKDGQLLVAFSRNLVTGSLQIEHSHGPTDARGIATTGTGLAANVYAAGGNTHSTTAYDFLATLECPAVPRLDCKDPETTSASKLIIKNSSKDSADAAIWKWSRGDVADLGDPLLDGYAFCVYSAASLQIEGRVGPGGGCSAGRTSKLCWSGKEEKISYRGSNGIPQGVRKVSVNAGEFDRGKVKIVAKGSQLEVPALGAFAAPLTVQLSHADECWAAQFSSPTVKGDKLTATSD